MKKIDIDNLDIDEIPEDDVFSKNKKKKVNGNKKGKRGERNICKELSKLFDDTFRRVPGSGMMLGGKNWHRNEGISNAAKNTLSGDIITPEWFPFSIESKNYADSPKLHNIYEQDDPDLSSWIDQAQSDSLKCNKDWLLIFNITSKRKTFVCLDLMCLRKMIEKYNLEMPESYFIYNKKYIIISKSVFFRNYLIYLKSIINKI